jgi:hypothetical protein
MGQHGNAPVDFENDAGARSGIVDRNFAVGLNQMSDARRDCLAPYGGAFIKVMNDRVANIRTYDGLQHDDVPLQGVEHRAWLDQANHKALLPNNSQAGGKLLQSAFE